jgi:hypothetical protein
MARFWERAYAGFRLGGNALMIGIAQKSVVSVVWIRKTETKMASVMSVTKGQTVGMALFNRDGANNANLASAMNAVPVRIVLTAFVFLPTAVTE